MPRRTAHARRSARSRRYWDGVSRWAPLLEGAAAGLDRAGVGHLGLRPGDRVLDAGCGGGAAFAVLRDAVGPTGTVVGVDHSTRMLDLARQRVDEHRWANVELRRADLTRAGVVDGEFDAAVAVFALTAMADVEAVLHRVHRALVPGGRLLVVDMDMTGRASSIVRSLYGARTGWDRTDPLAASRRVFDRVDELDHGAGRRAPVTTFVATRADTGQPA